MNKIERILTIAVLPAAIALATQQAHALQLNKVSSSVSSGISTVTFGFDQNATPTNGFMLENPSRLVFDFPKAGIKKTLPKSYSGDGVVKSIQVANTKDRVRATITLNKKSDFVTERKGNQLSIIIVQDGTRAPTSTQPSRQPMSDHDWVNKVAKASGLLSPAPPQPKTTAKTEPAPAPQKHIIKPTTAVVSNTPQSKLYLPEIAAMEPQIATQQASPPPVRTHGYSTIRTTNSPLPPKVQQARVATPQAAIQQPRQVTHNTNMLGDVDFRRDEKGNAHIIINLPSNRVHTEVTQAGNSLIAIIKGVKTPQDNRNYDVLDFATSVNNINVQRRGADARLRAQIRGPFEYTSAKRDSQLHIYVNKVVKKLTAEELRKKKKTYKGDKLTLNFQDIEVRSVLQLLADFTDKNIVVSDSVNGAITLRLKDVPWDQAMDIVLRSKGLGMRENGNVIWIAPESELSARENRELEQLQKKRKLESLITEYIPVNFAKATDLVSLIKSSATGKNNATLLSERGSISVDPRTNTILINDTVNRIEDIRGMIKKLDVPVRQVSIESRIVIASDTFTKELGTRFGVTGIGGFNGNSGIATTSGTLSATDSIVGDAAANLNAGGSVFPVGIPSLTDRLNVNLPATGGLGRFGFSILSSDYLVDLELSALQAESEGEIISTPRVVTTNQTKATIEQGVEIPFLQASSSGAANVAFKKAVLSLEVTPQITPEEHVIMDLKVNQDTVGQVFSGVPSINTREVQTNVLVENGQTVVLGGVHEETNSNDVDKVPLLGDLPVLGKMFKRTRKQNDKRELLIFVTPKILD
ncbi:MAG: Type IV pilus biogenesis protein PilQ [uncultured Thiotrichaceae bacterium]|uniref:Type IV pilus biogenesis protein PilQ n=1 Tax=uncultured Thiotrichaceae bacterium TaxID=298394 RepID=A0A6S6UC30_9GAMM|nr:MAG: Type IV pilus biogenesis protein PilQ [uncultured Thiotrichaceae bacterium]